MDWKDGLKLHDIRAIYFESCNFTLNSRFLLNIFSETEMSMQIDFSSFPCRDRREESTLNVFSSVSTTSLHGDILVVKKKARIPRCFLALLYNPKGVLKVDSYKDIAVLV